MVAKINISMIGAIPRHISPKPANYYADYATAKKPVFANAISAPYNNFNSNNNTQSYASTIEGILLYPRAKGRRAVADATVLVSQIHVSTTLAGVV